MKNSLKFLFVAAALTGAVACSSSKTEEGASTAVDSSAAAATTMVDSAAAATPAPADSATAATAAPADSAK